MGSAATSWRERGRAPSETRGHALASASTPAVPSVPRFLGGFSAPRTSAAGPRKLAAVPEMDESAPPVGSSSRMATGGGSSFGSVTRTRSAGTCEGVERRVGGGAPAGWHIYEVQPGQREPQSDSRAVAVF